MDRAPFQVLVLPFTQDSVGNLLYAVFQRAKDTGGYWQFIAGGGKNAETPLLAAKREAFEEAGITPENEYILLESMATIPVVNVSGFSWGENILVIPEHCLGVHVLNSHLTLSAEHVAYSWESYEAAQRLLRWDSNKNALWELDFRLRRNFNR